ncbi:MAG TPA: zf-HC2 domain-containing protein [Sedimentisphaerales bacterium]|nr:zf-HC2 domain-containing protein [Sedimentisphaerales bacterium]
MKRSCENISEMLVDYADGRLSPSESSEVAEHLTKCEQCQRTLQALQRSLELTAVIWEDGLAETKAFHIPIAHKTRKAHWPRYAAIAASILLVVTISGLWRALVNPTEKEPTFAEIERRISDSASAIQLLAAADLLAKYPDTEAIAKRQYHYVVKKYPKTQAAAEAKLRIQ